VAIQVPQQGDLQMARLVMPGVARQRPFDEIQRLDREPAIAAGQPRQFEVGRCPARRRSRRLCRRRRRLRERPCIFSARPRL
jgi:hypothetical protein